MSTKDRKSLNIRIPDYTLAEELFNAISHGAAAALSIVALVLMVIKAHGALAETCVSLFGATMIVLYTVSCIYHGLSAKLEGKKIMRVLDHCNVFLLVYGTYTPVSLLGVKGKTGWIMFGVVSAITLIGIIVTSINVDKYSKLAVFLHLLSGWSILLGYSALYHTVSKAGMIYAVLGGVFYTVGSILYGLGKNIRYMHCVFHVFCILGTFCHFWMIYMYLI